MIAGFFMLLSVALCLAGFISCAWHGGENSNTRVVENFNQLAGRNRYVVVLPFEGDDDNPQLASKIRQSFYSHFSPKNYHDVKPRDVDAMLDALDAFSRQQWRSLTPQELGRCFKADYLIYGKVLSTRRLFFIFYSQIALQVDIRMVETRSGRTVWQTELEKRLQNADVPLHPLSLVTAAVHTGVDAGDEHMQDLIERTCRELADSIPEPANDNRINLTSDIQIASFGSLERAQQMVSSLEARGYQPRIEHVRINGTDWYRVVVGPYSPDDAEKARRKFSGDPEARPVLMYAR